jgi:hypothetical protein
MRQPNAWDVGIVMAKPATAMTVDVIQTSQMVSSTDDKEVK